MKKYFCFILFVSFIFCQSISKADEKFLCISDIHFDPFYDTTLVHDLMKTPYEKWETVFEKSSNKEKGKYGIDANYFLLKSLLSEVSGKTDEFELIIISGDFLSHEFEEHFYEYSGTKSETELRSFIDKTIGFVKFLFDKYLPGKPMVIAFGNNDSYCGDYMLEPGGDFIKMFYDTWDERFASGNVSFDEYSNGYYDLYYPEGSRNRFIVLNTVYFSPKYLNKCGVADIDPADAQFSFLEQTLRESLEREDKVWLVYHIAPGADVYSTIKIDGDCKEKIILQWKDEYAARFIELTYGYKDIITAQIGGHIHRDDFRVLLKDDEPFSFIHLNPAVSPVYYNNPSYQFLSINPSGFTIDNAESFYTNLMNQDGFWRSEYNFNISYGESGINTTSLYNLWQRMETDEELQKKYFQYYTSFMQSGLETLESEWLPYWCGITRISLEDYEDCYCR